MNPKSEFYKEGSKIPLLRCGENVKGASNTILITVLAMICAGCISYSYDKLHMSDNKYDKKRTEENKADIQKAGLPTENVIPWVSIEKETATGEKHTVLAHTRYLTFDMQVNLECSDGTRTPLIGDVSWTANSKSIAQEIRGISPLADGKFQMQGVDPHHAWDVTFKIGTQEYKISTIGKDQFIKVKCNK